jgi:cyclin C
MLRQIPIATANVYFKRFYSKNAICETDPFMVAACCVYVAAKVDETPVHIKSVVSEARATFSGKPSRVQVDDRSSLWLTEP